MKVELIRTCKNIGTNIRKYRKKMGYSQEELARRMGRSCATIFRWESGSNFPTAEDMQKLAAVLEIDVQDLYREPEAEESAQADQKQYSQMKTELDNLRSRVEELESKTAILCQTYGRRL